MPIIKLDAIDSTNDYLKQLHKESEVENYTIVIADEQTKGKGQMGSKWISEKGKNLTMSVLVKNHFVKNENVFDLNIAVALSVLHVLKNISIPNVFIKWPNDILSDSKKVAGILIENLLKSDGSFTSIIGIGLNVNQTDFEGLPQAGSLKFVTGNTYDLDEIAILLRNSLQDNIKILAHNPASLWEAYHQNLYRINYPSAFEDKIGNRFMGLIRKVTKDGKLEVELEDDSTASYEVKEIQMLY